MRKDEQKIMKKGKVSALLPIGVFLILYLGLGILFEYILKIPMGFYSIPIVVIFLIALMVACLQNPRLSFDEKLSLMGKGIGGCHRLKRSPMDASRGQRRSIWQSGAELRRSSRMLLI